MSRLPRRLAHDDRSPSRIGESFPEVLEAARLGAEWAWSAIYRDLAPVVLSYLRARGVREAEDVTGEVFLQVARDVHSFSGGEAEFRSWVLVATHHRFLDHYRYHRRRPVEPVAPGTIADAGGRGNVEEEALRELSSAQVRQLIEGLAPLQRDVLILRIIAGLTVEEIARTIGKRPTSVKALQRRGLGAIRRAMAGQPPEDFR